MPIASARSKLTEGFALFESYSRANSAFFLRETLGATGPPLPRDNIAADGRFTLSPSEVPTVFHSAGYVEATLVQWAVHLQQNTGCTDELLAIALVLCARYASDGQPVTWHMLHRLYASALYVAMKTHCDRYLRQRAFADASSLHRMELPRLEKALVAGLQFRCTVLLSRGSLAASHGNALEATAALAVASIALAKRLTGARCSSVETSVEYSAATAGCSPAATEYDDSFAFPSTRIPSLDSDHAPCAAAHASPDASART